MRGRRSKNSLVEGLVTVHSGSVSFADFSALFTSCPDTALKRRTGIKNVREEHVVNCILPNQLQQIAVTQKQWVRCLDNPYGTFTP